jgi:uncharacterized repeat protein (TIGR01451 family)
MVDETRSETTNQPAASRRRPIFIASALITFALLALIGVAVAQAVCIPTSYTVTGSAPPPIANWTDTSGLWVPSGGFPGCAPGDSAADTNASPTTIAINSTIPNPIIGLNLACNGCVIDVQPGGQLTLAGFGSIGSGAALKVSGGTLILASGANLTFQSGSLFQLTSGMVDIQGGQMTVDGASNVGGTLQVSGGTLTIPPTASLSFQSGAQLSLIAGTINGGGTINNLGTVQMTGSTGFTVSATLNNQSGATGGVSVQSGTLSLAGGGTGDAPFTIASGGTLDFPSASYTMNTGGTVSGAGTLSVTGGTLSIGGVTSPGGFVLTAGTITGGGFLSIKKTMTWSGGTITGTGGTELAGTGVGTIDGASGPMLLDGRSFNDYGFIHYTATAPSLGLANSAALAIYGTFTLENDAPITTDGSATSVTVSPNGLLWKSGGTGTSTINPPTANNWETVVSSGTLELAGSGTHNGTFQASSPGTLLFSAASTTLTSSSDVSGDGTVAFNAGSTTIDTNFYLVTGLTSLSGSANVAVNAAADTEDLTFAMGTLNLGVNGLFTMHGLGTWSCGLMTGTGEFDVAANATLTIDGANSSPTIDAILFSNEGTVLYTANAMTANHLILENKALFSNNGLFDIQTDARIEDAGSVMVTSRTPSPAPTAAAVSKSARGRRRTTGMLTSASLFDNTATLQKSAGTGTTIFDPVLTNSGTVHAGSGTIDFTSSYTQSAGATGLAGGNITVATPLALNGGVLNGAGTITGDLKNCTAMACTNAQIAPSSVAAASAITDGLKSRARLISTSPGPTTTGTINITGNYTQGSAGLMTIKLASSTQSDVVNVTGTATLDGTFTATLVNSYAPANGTVWNVLTFASRTGDFATKNLPTYPIMGSIQSSYTPTAFVLTAVRPPSADLGTAMLGPATVNAGSPLSYTITISNSGPDTTSGTITVVDTLPAGVTGASGLGTGWTCNPPSGGTITCTNGTALTNGQSLQTLTVSMTSPPNAGNITNSATVSETINDPNPSNDTASVSTSVGPQADLSISKNGPATVNPGQNIVYTINFSNAGPSPAANTVISDPAPVGLAFISNSGACTTPFPCNLGTLSSGQMGSITSTYTVPGNFTQPTITNTATISSSANDPNMSNNTGTATTNVVLTADLSIGKSGPSSVNPGQNVTYAITVTNLGPSAAAGVVVSDPTPPGLTFVSNSGACATPFPCNLGSLASGQMATINATFSVPANYANPSITNTASVSSSANDPNPGNNTASVNTPVTIAADVSITKSGPPSFFPGQNISYTLTVMNSGALAANNVFVNDATPAGLTFVSNSGACATAFPCSLGTLTTGQTVTITSTYSVPLTYSGTTITNTATASTSSTDSNMSNNTAVAVTPVSTTGVADLSINKTGPAQASPNTNLTFKIQVFNGGPGTATNVIVSDPTPPGLAFVSNSGACITAFPCNIPTLAVGANIIINATYQVVPQARTVITNTASVTSSATDPNQSNNSSTARLNTNVIMCPSQTPQLVTPADGATTLNPVTFSWTPVPNATGYTVIINTGSGQPITISATGTSATATLPNGTYSWSVQALGTVTCRPESSATATFTVCNTPDAPAISVVGEVTTGLTYTVQWTAVDGATTYQLQESPDGLFNSPSVTTLNTNSKSFTKVIQTATPFFYRVRAFSACTQSYGPFSMTISVVVVPIQLANSTGANIEIPAGSGQSVTFPVFIAGLPTGTTSFVATVDSPWISVTPTSGIVPPQGITLSVTADSTSLANGTWTGTVIVVYGSTGVSAKVGSDAAAPTTSIPVSVNLVTPVTPSTLSTPSPTAQIIPSVGHLTGADSSWRSDIRIANTSSQTQKYQVTFNGGSGGLVKLTTISIDPGVTTALDDLVRNWFGIGSLSDSSNGVLSIQLLDNSGKPVLNDLSKATTVSSRTYNATSTAGTLGQYVPPTVFANFIGSAVGNAKASILSLQQIAQSDAFRTNLGLVEAAGKPVSALVSVFDGSGSKLLGLPVALNAGEQRQLNSFLAQNGLSLTNGHIEVQVVGGSGKVTTYASVVDDGTADPLLVSGIPLGSTSSRFVIPAVADLNNSLASWRSDLRVLNGGASPQTATVTFYPSGNASGNVSKQVTVNPGEVKALDNILQSLFGLMNVGGTVHVTTATDSPLVVTARTYDQTATGTLGQFIQAVTPNDAVGFNDRTLQILQVEESVRYRTNLGLAEVTGKPVTLEVSVFLPNSKVNPKLQIPLGPYESRQFPILRDLNIGATYNGRISVRVIDGDGKVTAYSSVVDMTTQAPTYIPAQ